MASFTVEDRPDQNNNEANTVSRDENVFHIDISPSSWLKIEDFECASKSVQFSLNGLLEEEDFMRLNMFEGVIVNSSRAMFCGGPVTAMAWSRNNPDILAIASKKEFTASSTDNMDPDPGLVQLWSAGTEGARPELLFSIHHNHGIISDLEWAPSGGPGLGALAAACGDGAVRVWAMPLSEQLGSSGAVFTMTADLNLVVGDPIDGAGQCLGLSWYQGPGHGYLAACFTSGLVSLWHLTTTSFLLRSEDTILPVQTWPAHYGCTAGVSLYPGTQPHPTHAVTAGGKDYCIKFWDLRDDSLAIVLRVVEQGMILDVKWISDWGSVCVIFDDLSKSGLLVAEPSSKSTPFCPMVSEVSTVTGLALSPWPGCAALCTSAGELIVCELEDRMEQNQEPGCSVGHVYKTEVVPVLGHSPLDPGDRREYEAVAASSRLVYHDTGLQHPDPAENPLQMEPEDVTSFPLAGLTSVAWNPGRRRLLASGGQAGIVRVHNLKKLGSHAMP